MKAIWKFEVPIEQRPSIQMPKDAEILAFQVQGKLPYIWAIVELGEKDMETRHFAVIGAGHAFDRTPGTYVGTVQMFGGQLVWHLFEILEEVE